MLITKQRDGIEMKITEKQLRSLVRKALLLEKSKKEDNNIIFDPEDVSLPMNRRVKKFLDPETTPIKKAKFETEIDTDGTIQQQSQALAAKALSYADKAPKDSLKLMNMSRSMLQRMMKNMGASPGDEAPAGGGDAVIASDLIDNLATSGNKNENYKKTT